MDNARLALAVLLSPTLDENFTVVDDLNGGAGAAAVLADVRDDGGAANPDLRAADEALRAAEQDVRLARSAFFPTSWSTRCTASRRTSSRLHSRIAAQPELGVAAESGILRHRQPDGAGVGLGRAAQQAASEPDARAPGADRRSARRSGS